MERLCGGKIPEQSSAIAATLTEVPDMQLVFHLGLHLGHTAQSNLQLTLTNSYPLTTTTKDTPTKNHPDEPSQATEPIIKFCFLRSPTIDNQTSW